MTEEKAKTKWCPMSMDIVYSPNGVGSANRSDGRITSATKCIGSDCMVWRELTPPEDRGVRNSGYCGLAGKP